MRAAFLCKHVRFSCVFYNKLTYLLPLLTNTLPGPSASEVTTLWRCIIITIIMETLISW